MRKILAILVAACAVATVAVVVAPDAAPGVQVTKTEALTYPSVSRATVTFTTLEKEWVPGISCKFGASATAIGGSKIRLIAYFQDCKAKFYKTVCARLWNENWKGSNSGPPVVLVSPRTLVRSTCLTAGNGSTGGIMPSVDVVVATTTYAVEVLAFMGTEAKSELGNTMEAHW